MIPGISVADLLTHPSPSVPSMRAPVDLADPTGQTFGDYVRHHLQGSYDNHKVTT